MNVLEKILEEIDRQKRVCLEIDNGEEFNAGALDMANSIKNFIRKRMDDGNDIDVSNADEPYITLTLNEDGVAEVYDDTYDITINCESEEEQGRVVGMLECFRDWIPVEERLPEVPERLPDEYCPEFNVTIKGAERATTLKYRWDGTWFDDYGTVYNVIAWQPLPKPYIPNELPTAKNT